MNLTVLANSTLYTPMPDVLTTLNEDSTLHLLQECYPKLNGIWLNGLTILNVRQVLSRYIRERFRTSWVIINVGAVECYSHASINFLQWCCHYLNFYGIDNLFSTFVIPKMLRVADSLCSGKEEFFQLLSAFEFGSILYSTLRLLEGFSVIVIGMNEPKTENEKWKEQAREYENEIISVCGQYNNVIRIDSWNMYSSYIVDTTHLTPEGHNNMFRFIQTIIENEGRKHE